MRTSQTVGEIAKALIVAHAKIKHATKDSQNPHFRSDYASLEAVIDVTKTAYLESDIIVLQGMNEVGDTLTTRLQHSSGEFYESDTKLILSKQDMQGLGSAITYARRYSLSGFSNLTQADDDGNVASGLGDRKPAQKRAGKAPTSNSSNDQF
jgi:hypothetical protein